MLAERWLIAEGPLADTVAQKTVAMYCHVSACDDFSQRAQNVWIAGLFGLAWFERKLTQKQTTGAEELIVKTKVDAGQRGIEMCRCP